MKAKLSVTLLEPDNVLVVSIVISITSLTLASITAPAETFKLLVMSRNRRMSLMLLPRFANLPVNMLTVIESDNSLGAKNCLDEESANDDKSEEDLLPANSLDNESSGDKISVELLDPENNLVVSMVTRIMSEGSLFAMNNLVVVSVNDRESDKLLGTDKILFVMSDMSTKSVKALPRIDSLSVNMLNVTESVSSLPRSVFLSNESMKPRLSVVGLTPDNVLVVSMVINMTSGVTLASITVPAALDVMLTSHQMSC